MKPKVSKERYNQLSQKWYKYIMDEIEKEGNENFYKNLTVNQRKENYMNFMLNEYKEELLENYNESAAIEQINEQLEQNAELYNKFFDKEYSKTEPTFGGRRKKYKRRNTRKKSR